MYRIALLIALMLFTTTAFCQKINPDSFYDSIKKPFSSKLVEKEPEKYLNLFKELDKKYKLSVLDVGWYWELACKLQDTDAFYSAATTLISYTADSLDIIIRKHLPDFSEMKYPKLYQSYLKIKREEFQLIHVAKLSLNWAWIKKLNYLTGFDLGIRYTERGDFKNRDSFIHSLVIIDSINLDAFASFVKTNGFPKMFELGTEWGKIQGLLHHLKDITTCTIPEKCRDNENHDKCRADYLSFMPQFYQTTIEGQGSPSFYRYIYQSLVNDFTKAGYLKDLELLKKYKL